MQNFEHIRSHIATSNFEITMQEPYVICVELSFENGRRHQAIFLSEIQNDDALNYLRVSTVVAPVEGMNCMRALAFNWDSHVGYLAIGDLDGVSYIQLCENRPYEGLTSAEVDRLILEVGGMGDHIERMLSAGDFH